MASDVMSLFGMNPNVIQQNRVQGGVDQASRMSADYAIGAAGGGMLGAGINSAFGLQTPDMAQAQGIKDSMQGADLNTPAGLRSAAQKLMMNGDYAQAMALHTRANQLEATGVESTRATEDRALGQSRNVIVTPASTNAIGVTTPAVTHSVTQYPDGRIADATQGKEYPTYAAWMASLKRGAGGDDTDDEKSGLSWSSSTGQWVDNRTTPDTEGVVSELSEEQQKTIQELEKRLENTSPDSTRAGQLQSSIDNVNRAGEEAGLARLSQKKKQVAYYTNTIQDSLGILAMFTKPDGTLIQTNKVGNAQQNLRNALDQIYNITGKEYNPEDYPVETTEK